MLKGVLGEIFRNYNWKKKINIIKNLFYNYFYIIKIIVKFHKKAFELLLIKEKDEKLNFVINFNIKNEYYSSYM